MRYLYLCCCVAALFFTACENETAYELPVIADEFITFTIDGQDITLDALPNAQVSYTNHLQTSSGNLDITRASRDRTTTMRIIGRNLPVTGSGDDFRFNASGYVPIEITVYSNFMSGSIYCPHPEDDTRVTYQALLRVEEISKQGVMRGAFRTDPNAAGNAATIVDGSFTIGVSLD